MNRPSTAALALLIALPLAKLGLHLSAGAGYGYHGDELYYLACANHLDWGYVDHPPVSILVLAVTRALVGDGIAAIRVVPAIAGALTVFFVGLTTRRLGGGVFALALAMLAAIAAPFYLATSSYFSMNAIDFLVWAIAGWLSVRLLSDEPGDSGGAAPPTRLWIALGVLLGVGVENKLSVLWLGGGLFLGLLLTSRRSLLKTRGPWLAVGIAAVFFVPQVIWQLTHNLETVRWMMGAAEDRPRAPLTFLASQFPGMLQVAAPIWLAGLIFFLVLPQGRRYRPLGWTWLAVGTLLTLNSGSRPYYLAPAYAWLLAGGAVTMERWSANRWIRGIGVAYLALIAVRGLQIAPYVVPILPEATLAAADSATQKLPEFLSQMSGYEEFAGQLAGAYDTLPEAERSRAMVLVAYYSFAGAVDLMGRARGLPLASSTNNSYWFWGPQGSWDGPVIVLGYPERLVRDCFAEVTQVGASHCTYCQERPHPIWIARGLRVPKAALWHKLRYRD